MIFWNPGAFPNGFFGLGSPSPILWFSPKDNSSVFADGVASTASGELVELVTGQSSTPLTATQTLLTRRPRHAPGINGFNSLQFDGGDDRLDFSAITLSGNWCCSAVTKINSFPSVYIGHSSANSYIEQTSSTTLTISMATGVPFVITHSALNSNPHVITLTLSGSTVSRYLDGVLDGSVDISGQLIFNCLGYRADGISMDGHFGTIELFTANLSDQKRTDLIREQGLAYGVTVA